MAPKEERAIPRNREFPERCIGLLANWCPGMTSGMMVGLVLPLQPQLLQPDHNSVIPTNEPRGV